MSNREATIFADQILGVPSSASNDDSAPWDARSQVVSALQKMRFAHDALGDGSMAGPAVAVRPSPVSDIVATWLGPESGIGTKEEWSTQYVNNLPDSWPYD